MSRVAKYKHATIKESKHMSDLDMSNEVFAEYVEYTKASPFSVADIRELEHSLLLKTPQEHLYRAGYLSRVNAAMLYEKLGDKAFTLLVANKIIADCDGEYIKALYNDLVYIGLNQEVIVATTKEVVDEYKTINPGVLTEELSVVESRNLSLSVLTDYHRFKKEHLYRLTPHFERVIAEGTPEGLKSLVGENTILLVAYTYYMLGEATFIQEFVYAPFDRVGNKSIAKAFERVKYTGRTKALLRRAALVNQE